MLSEHEERVLARIARQTSATDPGFARRLAAGQPRRPFAGAAAIVGGGLVIVSSVFVLVPVVVFGAVLLLIGLWRLPVTNTQPSLRD